MPAGMGTGTDTRMYAPRSESDHLYTADDEDSYKHGKGSPEKVDELKDKRMQEKDAETKVSDNPHLKVSVEEPEPEMPPDMPVPQEMEEEGMEETPMANQAELSDITGSVGTGSPDVGFSVGAQAMSPFGQNTLATGEPMDLAFRLLKEDQICDVCNGQGSYDRPNFTYQSGEPFVESQTVTCYHCGGTGKHIDERIHPGPISGGSYENKLVQSKDGGRPVGFIGTKPVHLRHIVHNNSATNQGIPFNPATGFTRSEPLDIAHQLLKRNQQDIDNPVFQGPPGGRRPDLATSMRSKRQSRTLSPRTEHGGLTDSELAVEMSHLGDKTKQPSKLFPGKYRQNLGQRAARRNVGNISMPYQTHNVEQRTPVDPGSMGSGKMPRLAGELSKSELKDMGMLLKSAENYLHISQLRNLLRDLKRAIKNKDSTNKAPPSGKGSSKEGEAGHRDGETTQPQGGTDNKEADEMRSSGASGNIFVSRGSGRTP